MTDITSNKSIINKAGPFELGVNYLRLSTDLSAEVLPVDDTFWARLLQGELGTFSNEYLITQLSFSEDWSSWEIHPQGDEIVFLLSGAAEFVLESPQGEQTSLLVNKAGQYVLVPKGFWHTAKIVEAASMIFITPGEGTANRPV